MFIYELISCEFMHIYDLTTGEFMHIYGIKVKGVLLLMVSKNSPKNSQNSANSEKKLVIYLKCGYEFILKSSFFIVSSAGARR